MEFGNIKDFQQGQASKLEKCKKAEERRKKAVFQMRIMVEKQCSDTLEKEAQMREQQVQTAESEANTADTGKKKSLKPDLYAEMEKMAAAASRNAGGIRAIL